jgi:adenylylsulfate reductase, subunit B
MPPVINEAYCIACNECVELCPQDVFWGSEKLAMPVVRYGDECWHCGVCEEACPEEGAIRIRVPLSAMVLYQ